MDYYSFFFISRYKNSHQFIGVSSFIDEEKKTESNKFFTEQDVNECIIYTYK